ncbi:MAG: type I-B CRISPR-associated protein Cas5b [Dictyoglomaceae bacterium]
MDNKIKALKIKIYQPQAHYRIPFTYGRRHTYPIPPYSTVLGLIANVLGIRNIPGQEEPCINENCNCDYHKLKEVKISICGKFVAKTTEYTWLRNLSKEAHTKRFGVVENRYVGGYIEHIGGQIPAFIDILNEVNILIYLYHYDINFLEKIKETFENPVNDRSPLHLGRAEDWIVIEDLDYVDLVIDEINGNYGYFFWVPEKIFFDKFDFDKVEGLLYNLPTFYKIKDGIRNFVYIRTKLNDGNLGDILGYLDEKEDIPIFLADLKGG